MMLLKLPALHAPETEVFHTAVFAGFHATSHAVTGAVAVVT